MAAFDETFDWVVAGSGAGSMSSALVMRRAGKSVVILEKTKYIGGTTAKSGGVMWIPGNRFMQADGEGDTTEKAITYLDALQDLEAAPAPGTTREKRLAYVAEAPKAIDFLVDQGIELARGHSFWPDYYDELPGGCKTTRTVVAKPFNRKELGPLAKTLRLGFAEYNTSISEAMQMGHARTNPESKKIFRRIALRTVWDKLHGRDYTTAGAALQGRMLKACVAAGVEVRIETPVTEVIIEGGKAVGVLTVKDGKPWRIAARLGVLVNAGGFAQNQAMRDKYMPGTKAAWSETTEGDTGEMQLELERLGGTLAQMDQFVGFQMTLPPGSENDYVKPGMQSVTGKPHAILVDQSGVRYMNEGGSYELYCETMVKRNREVPAIPSWAIVDQQYAERYKLGGEWVDQAVPKKWEGKGYLHKAATVAELAASIGADPAVLTATVDRWNGFVRGGKDEDFHRGEREYDSCGFVGDPYSAERSLGTIERGPFFAVPVLPGDVSTYGGVVTDASSRVLKADGSAIEGLYATGVTTASVMGNAYPGAGSSVGPSLVFGWIAAKHAAGLGNQAL